LSVVRKLLLSFLLLAVSLSFFSCGKKTPLFLKDRTNSSGTVNPSEEGKHDKK